MWQRFTERARRVVFFSQEEAAQLGHAHVGSEHLLLGLLRENDSVAARILDRMGIALSPIRAEIERNAVRGEAVLGQDMQLTPVAKRAIDLAYEEARALSNNYIGTEHLLLGLIRDPEGSAGQVLAKVGVNLERAREEIRSLQDNDSGNANLVDMRPENAPNRLGDYLLTKGYATSQEVEEAKGVAQNNIEDLVKILIDMGVNPTHVYEAMAHALGKSFIDLNAYIPDRDALSALPEEVAKRHNVLPVKKDGKTLYVAMKDVGDLSVLVELLKATNCTVRGIFAVPEHITDAIARLYTLTDDKRFTSFYTSNLVPELRVSLELDEAGWRGRSLVTLGDVSTAQVLAVLECAARFKALKRADKYVYFEHPQTLALLFEKPSLRTRVSFEAGMAHLGGHAIYLAPADVGLGVRESVADVAAGLSRWADLIAARTFKHETIEELAAQATVPVINALSDREHPIQAFADLMTIIESKGTLGNHLKLAYVGDGNNVLHALLLACAKVGVNLTAACPQGYEPSAVYVEEAQLIGTEEGGSGAQIEIVSDPIAAVKDADVVYTDVWTSMGQEAETKQRLQILAPYQVNAALLKHAKSDVIVLHCLPAHREEEITTEVMEAYKTTIQDQAENRLHTQKALIALMLGM